MVAPRRRACSTSMATNGPSSGSAIGGEVVVGGAELVHRRLRQHHEVAGAVEGAQPGLDERAIGGRVGARRQLHQGNTHDPPLFQVAAESPLSQHIVNLGPMRAVIVNEPGGVDALEVVERPDPEPGPGEVLIRVRAAGVNRPDLLQRQGLYQPPPGTTDILGLECSGEVAALGADVDRIRRRRPGLRAAGRRRLRRAGRRAGGSGRRVPEGVDLVDAAGLMETTCTVWSNVVMVGGLEAGQRLLVHGGASGIGTSAIQIATALGARVATTVGSAEKADACRELGADIVVNYREQDFVEELRDDPADVVLDIIGAKYLASNLDGPRPGRPARHHRDAGRHQGRARHRRADAHVGLRHRDVAAAPPARGEGGDRRADRRARVADDRGRPRAADRARDLPARRRRAGAPGAGGLHPHRQGAAHALMRRLGA